METKGKAAEAQHPLADWKPKCSVSAKQWLEEFRGAESVYHKLSLLQYGMDLEFRYGGWSDVVQFYFAVAEGHTGDLRILNSHDENDSLHDTPFSEMRTGGLSHVVARKAFEVICLRILKNTEKSESNDPSWASLVCDKEMSNMLLHFFRLKDDPSDRPRFVNLKYFGPGDRDDRHTLIAVAFLEELVNRTWPLNERYSRLWNYEETIQMFRRNRQKMMEILYGLNRLPLLIRRAGQINSSQMDWLKRVALGNGKFSTVEEAAWNGNEAARVWIMLNTLEKESKRQAEIRRAKEQEADAQSKLKKLNS